MGRRCEEPHCLQIIPERLFQSHQDLHYAERLAAEDFERQRHSRSTDQALTRTLSLGSAEDESSNVNDEESDYLLALALNREFRKEEEELSFRSVQVIQTKQKRQTNTNSARRGKLVLKVRRRKRDTVKVSNLTKLCQAPQSS